MIKNGLPREFRGDIQGLRAFAVLAVLVNHAFPSALPGGFIGVDIFFTISGYLIGKHLLISLKDGSFSFWHFYAKRARRIFPALAVMLLAVWCLAYLSFMAPDFAVLGKHIAVSAAFSNNILLWTESGYFDTSALAKPLLHLWSLGIEEQFYLLAPCLLWAGLKFELRAMAWITRLGVLSLALMLFCSALYPESSFYLIHTRFWELAAGMAIGFLELQKKPPNAFNPARQNFQKVSNREVLLLTTVLMFSALLLLGSTSGLWSTDTVTSTSGLMLLLMGSATIAVHSAINGRDSTSLNSRLSLLQCNRTLIDEVFALLGFSILCLSVLVLSPSTWPGAQALWPILGSLILVMGPRTTAINRVLACRPMAWIGGISYPLYLWHWPMIVLWRMVYPEAGVAEQMIPLGTSFVLAWLTKRFVEDPVRVDRVPHGWPVFFPLAFACLLGLVTVIAQGLPSRFPANLRAIAQWSEPRMYEQWRSGSCYHHPSVDRNFANECTPPKRVGVPLILLWGDSHAGHLYRGLMSLKDDKTFDIAQWTTGSCPPTLTPMVGEGLACPVKRAKALQMLRQSAPDTVLISGAWELYLNQEDAQEIILNLEKTVRHLKEFGVKRVIVFGPGPTWHRSLPSDLFTHMIFSKSEEIPARLGHVSPKTWRFDAAMATQVKASGAHYFSVLSLLCNAEGCLTVSDRTRTKPDLLFVDRDHLTVSGSTMVMRAAQNLVLDWDLPQ